MAAAEAGTHTQLDDVTGTFLLFAATSYLWHIIRSTTKNISPSSTKPNEHTLHENNNDEFTTTTTTTNSNSSNSRNRHRRTYRQSRSTPQQHDPSSSSSPGSSILNQYYKDNIEQRRLSFDHSRKNPMPPSSSPSSSPSPTTRRSSSRHLWSFKSDRFDHHFDFDHHYQSIDEDSFGSSASASDDNNDEDDNSDGENEEEGSRRKTREGTLPQGTSCIPYKKNNGRKSTTRAHEMDDFVSPEDNVFGEHTENTQGNGINNANRGQLPSQQQQQRQEAENNHIHDKKSNQNDNDDDISSFHKVREVYNSKIMPRRLIMIRHGQSEGNVNEEIYTKCPDSFIRLTKLGWDQAKLSGRILRKHILKQPKQSHGAATATTSVHFIVSPYIRCMETFHGLASAWCDPKQFEHIQDENVRIRLWYQKLAEMGVTFNEDPRIREQDFGNYQDKETIKKAKAERYKFGIFYYRFPNGESASDVFDRVSTFLDSLWRSFCSNPSKNYVLVTHGISIRVLLARYFRYTVDQFNVLVSKTIVFLILVHRSVSFST